jgi:hypothetical protein
MSDDLHPRFSQGAAPGAGFRRVQRSVNGLLTGSWRVVLSAVGAVFDKGVVFYG